MSRRQTLGVLSPSQFGGQGSKASGTGAPQRVASAKENNAETRRSRKSIAVPSDLGSKPTAHGQSAGPLQTSSQANSSTTMDARRSSAYNSKGGAAAGVKADPRPITDKSFLGNCVRTVITYLSTHGYPAPVSPKTLSSPTAKEFTQMVQFLIQQFDVNMKSFGKIEDDVPLFFRRICYPFQISKSALFAVGSPHSWPSVLAAMTWLVELLTYNERTEEQSCQGPDGSKPGMLDDPESATKRQFFEYICTSYKYFLAGDDARCNAVDEDMLQQFTSKEQAIIDTKEHMLKVNSALSQELHHLESQPSPLLAAQQRQAERALDTDKFQKLIENLQSMKSSLQKKLGEKVADLEGKQGGLADLEKEAAALRAKVASQPLSKADVNRMVLERTKQKEALEAVNCQAEELEQHVHAQEVQFLSALKSLEAGATRYNQLAHRLKLIPASAKRADGVVYELRLSREADTATELANIDMKGAVKPALERLSETYRTKASQLGRDLVGLKEALLAVGDSINERREENTVTELQIAKLESQLRAEREAQEGRLKGVAGQAKKVAEEVVGLRSSASTRLADIEARKDAVMAEVESTQRRCEVDIGKLRSSLSAALDAMLQHHVHVDQRLQQTSGAVRAAQMELMHMTVPQRS